MMMNTSIDSFPRQKLAPTPVVAAAEIASAISRLSWTSLSTLAVGEGMETPGEPSEVSVRLQASRLVFL